MRVYRLHRLVVHGEVSDAAPRVDGGGRGRAGRRPLTPAPRRPGDSAGRALPPPR
jgi:hypothetical protein